jgi:hypothetical protein
LLLLLFNQARRPRHKFGFFGLICFRGEWLEGKQFASNWRSAFDPTPMLENVTFEGVVPISVNQAAGEALNRMNFRLNPFVDTFLFVVARLRGSTVCKPVCD